MSIVYIIVGFYLVGVGITYNLVVNYFKIDSDNDLDASDYLMSGVISIIWPILAFFASPWILAKIINGFTWLAKFLWNTTTEHKNKRKQKRKLNVESRIHELEILASMIKNKSQLDPNESEFVYKLEDLVNNTRPEKVIRRNN